MTLVSTMDVLLNRYSLPFLVFRLKAIIASMIEENLIVEKVRAKHEIKYAKLRKGVDTLSFMKSKYKNNTLFKMIRRRLRLRKIKRFGRGKKIQKNMINFD
jgi:hypothetical protein